MAVDYKPYDKKCPNCSGSLVAGLTPFGLRAKCEGKGSVPGCKFSGIMDSSQRSKSPGRKKTGSSEVTPATTPAKTTSETKPATETERKPATNTSSGKRGEGYGDGDGWIPGWPD
jgi:hypothetical protein